MALFIFIFFLLLYLLTLSNTIFGGDAGDLLSAILTKGIPHAPGYYLYTSLGVLMNKLPLNLTAAGKVTLISVFSTTLSLFVLYKVIELIAQKKYLNKYLLTITILLLGFSYVVWLYAIVPEVFPLNTLITLSIFYFSLLYYQDKKNKYLYILVFLIGLAITHHHTFVLVLPSLLYLYWQRRKDIVIKLKQLTFSFISFLIGLIPLTYILYSNHNQTNAGFFWQKINSLPDLLNFMLRTGYGTFQAGSFVTNLSTHRLLQLSNLVTFIMQDFMPLGLIFFILALIFTLRLKKSLTKTCLIAVLINIATFGPFFFFYANFPIMNNFWFATFERFTIIFYFFFVIYIYFGIYIFLDILKNNVVAKLVHNISLQKISLTIVLFFFISYPGLQFLKNYRLIAALKNSRLTENIGFDILSNATPNSIILLEFDSEVFNTQYTYYNNLQLQKDKIIVHASKLYSNDYVKRLEKAYPKLILKNKQKDINGLVEFVNANKEKFPIFSNQKYRLSNISDYEWIPQGILFKLEKKSDEDVKQNISYINDFWKKAKNRDLVDELKNNPDKWKHFFMSEILRIYSVAHQNSAYYLLLNNDLKDAYPHILDAMSLLPEDYDNFYLMSWYYRKLRNCSLAEDWVNKAIKLRPDKLYLDQLAKIGKDCFKDKQNTERINSILKKYKDKNQTPLKSF